MAKRDEYLAHIRKQLSVFEVEVRQNNKVNRQGINISAEDILGGLLNLLHDWNLNNANEGDQNFPAIDLADWDEGVVVQVSSDTSSTKIKETLAKLRDPIFEGREITKLVMMFLKPKQKYTTVFEHDGFELEIVDFDDLSRAVEHKSIKKLREISAYLDEELGELFVSEEEVSLPSHLLPGVPAASEYFLEGSRDRELDSLSKALQSGKPVFIWGIGGMGKTQTAIQLAKRCKPARGAYFLRYTLPTDFKREAMRETIRKANFSGFRAESKMDTKNEDPEILAEKEYQQKLDILSREYSDTLLVIDNFDCPGKGIEQLKAEQSYQDVTSLINNGVQLVFTTRYPTGEPDWEIRPLTEAQLIVLMRQSCKSMVVTDEQLRSLIRAVGGHTLMVDLIAKTLEESWHRIKPDDILDALNNATLDKEQFPEVTSDKDGTYIQGQIFSHLSALFDLSGLSDNAQNVLRFATLISEDGMDDLMLQDALPVEQQQELHNLVKRGWLQRENGVITIHPAVLQVCAAKLTFAKVDCCDFAEALWLQCKHFERMDTMTIQRVAKCLSNCVEKIPNPVKALEVKKKTLDLWEKILPAGHPDLASYYNNLGYAYGDLGDYRKKLEYNQKALAIREKALPADHPSLAASYNNVGHTYGDLGDHRKALEYSLKALDTWEKVLPSDHPDLATSYNNVGSTYGALGDHRKALEYQLKALAIREKVLPPDHPSLATSYNNIGITYANLEQFPKALEYLEKALAIWRKSLPAGHPNIASTERSIKAVRTWL